MQITIFPNGQYYLTTEHETIEIDLYTALKYYGRIKKTETIGNFILLTIKTK
jgi:hypothetical protein